jgi:hypothetical protein
VLRHAAYETRHKTQSGHSPLPPLRIGFAPSFWRRVARRASHGYGHITHQNSTRENVLRHAAYEKRPETQSGHSPLPPLRIGFAPSFWRRVARRASHGDGHITHQHSTREKMLSHAAHEKRHRTQSGHSPIPPLRIGFAPSFWRRVACRASHGYGHITHQNSTREKVLRHAAYEKMYKTQSGHSLLPPLRIGIATWTAMIGSHSAGESGSRRLPLRVGFIVIICLLFGSYCEVPSQINDVPLRIGSCARAHIRGSCQGLTSLFAQMSCRAEGRRSVRKIGPTT